MLYVVHWGKLVILYHVKHKTVVKPRILTGSFLHKVLVVFFFFFVHVQLHLFDICIQFDEAGSDEETSSAGNLQLVKFVFSHPTFLSSVTQIPVPVLQHPCMWVVVANSK